MLVSQTLGLADTAEPLRKIVRSLPTKSPNPHNSSPSLTSNPSDDEAAVATEQILLEASVRHLLTLGLETEKPLPDPPPKLVRPASTIPC